MKVRVLSGIGEVSREAWNALGGEGANPFTDHRFLEALEESGCAAPATGWTPRHLTLWDGGQLVAAAPAYVRDDSDGDFARDWDLGGAVERAGRRYYPKLALTVPFTPVTGRRVLHAPSADPATATAALFAAARDLARDQRLGSVQVLFPHPGELAAIEAAGLAPRLSFQYHWRNAGYRSMDEFLERFSSKRRNSIRRERAAPARQGLSIRTLRGAELRAERSRLARDVEALHRSTVDKLMWGRRWLDAGFYHRVFEAMPEHLEVVEARDAAGRLVAGAFNVATPTHLFGRYWGCFEEQPFLHFNVCMYHSIEQCIGRGVQVFEGGAGGEHKLARGFEPAETWSAHFFADEELDEAFRRHLARETAERRRRLDRWLREENVLVHPPRSAAEASS